MTGIVATALMPQVSLMYAGPGAIADLVTFENGAKRSALVRVAHRRSGAFVAVTESDAESGQYRIEGLSLRHEFVVWAVDPARQYNAVIADGLTAVVLDSTP